MNRLAILLLLVGFLSGANAQLDVTLEMKRNLFMRGEPIEAVTLVLSFCDSNCGCSTSASPCPHFSRLTKTE